jgi:hypothetical protein
MYDIDAYSVQRHCDTGRGVPAGDAGVLWGRELSTDEKYSVSKQQKVNKMRLIACKERYWSSI